MIERFGQKDRARNDSGRSENGPIIEEHVIVRHLLQICRRVDRDPCSRNGHVRGVNIDRFSENSGACLDNMHTTITFSQVIAGVEFNNKVRFEESFGRIVRWNKRENVRTFIVSDLDRSQAICVSRCRRRNGNRLSAIEERIIDSSDREGDRALSVGNKYGCGNSRFRSVATRENCSDCTRQVARGTRDRSNRGPTVFTHERLIDGDSKPERNRC